MQIYDPVDEPFLRRQALAGIQLSAIAECDLLIGGQKMRHAAFLVDYSIGSWGNCCPPEVPCMKCAKVDFGGRLVTLHLKGR